MFAQITLATCLFCRGSDGPTKHAELAMFKSDGSSLGSRSLGKSGSSARVNAAGYVVAAHRC